MNSRERVLASINHEIPDVIPVYVMAIESPEALYEQFRVSTDEDLRIALGIDIQPIWPEYAGPEIPNGLTIWGTGSCLGNAGYSESRGGHPLRDATSIRDVERHSWPSAQNMNYSRLEQRAKDSGDLASMLCPGWEPVFCRILDLFGMEEAMVKMHTHPAVVEAAVAHIAEYVLELAERSLECTEGYADIFCFGDDFAMQNGMIISSEHWRKLLKPVYSQVFALAKAKGVPVWFHSCGSFVDVLPDLIDIGMDVWETCQVHLKGNDPSYLKREFGSHIAFYGAVNTQQTLPFGSTSDVRREVRERVAVLGRGGGYICGPDHTVRPEVPVENLLALIDEAKKCRDPQCTSAP